MYEQKLYYKDVNLTTCTSTVLSVMQLPDSHSAKIVFDKTIFFPEGGGQSCDLGKIGKFEVTDVQEVDSEIIHTIAVPSGDALPEVGDKIGMQIDWNRRFDNMQRHCGEHILSGVFDREYGGVNRGFHMGDEYMTVDISLDGELTPEMAMHAEDCANEIIWSNLPVITTHYDSKEEAANAKVRKPLTVDEDITIVCVGDPRNPSDCVACCGTHPETSGRVGLLKIYKVEKNKGMFRIYFEAGRRAMDDYDKKHDIMTFLGGRYSAGTDDFMDKYEASENHNKTVREELNTFRRFITEQEINRIRSTPEEDIIGLIGNDKPITLRRYEIFKADDLTHIGRPLAGDIDGLLILSAERDNVLQLFSNNSVDCGRLIKDNAGIYNGKGGGRPDAARVSFGSAEDMNLFIDLICKHLK